MIDSFFVRFGDLLSAGLVFVGTTVLGLGTAGFSLANIGLAAIGLSIAVIVGHTYVKFTQDRAQGSPLIASPTAGAPARAR